MRCHNFINKINMFKIEIINAKIDNVFAIRAVRDALMIFFQSNNVHCLVLLLICIFIAVARIVFPTS